MTEKKTKPAYEPEQHGLPSGRSQQVGNYLVLKYTKALGSKDLKALRAESGVAKLLKERGYDLHRGTVPYIKVSTIGGEWEIHFAVNTTMFHYIDSRFSWIDGKCVLDNESQKALYSLFLLFYGDTTILGDAEYIENKGLCLKDFLERQKALGSPAADATGTVAESDEDKAADATGAVAESDEDKAADATGAVAESDEDKAADDAIISEMKELEEAKANIIDMKEGGRDGE